MNQSSRLLSIYTRLLMNASVNKKQLSREWDVSPRTIQRDIDDIRHYIFESEEWSRLDNEVIYSHIESSYKLLMTDDQVIDSDVGKLSHSLGKNGVHITNKLVSKSEQVSFEMTYDIWRKLRHRYPVDFLEDHKEDYVTATFSMSSKEAIYLAFKYKNAIRIIAPYSIRTQVTETLLAMVQSYINGNITIKGE